MTTEDKNRVLAELDGFEWFTDALGHRIFTKPYTTSYDAIIPLVQKQPENIIDEFLECLCVETEGEPLLLHVNLPQLVSMWKATPEKLCDALIKAVRKWKD